MNTRQRKFKIRPNIDNDFVSLSSKIQCLRTTADGESHRATNVTYQNNLVGRELRAKILGRYPGFRGCTIWFTGLSGAGKTTISFALERTLCNLGLPTYSLDGDNVRHGVCANLGFSPDDREENIRRVGHVSRLFADLGIICLSSFISPYEKDRRTVRIVHEQVGLPFIEVYVNTNLEICEQRDTKGLYSKARAGKITGFTGIDSAYEVPVNPELIVEAGRETVEQSVQKVLEYLYERKILPKKVMQQFCTPEIRELFVSENEKDEKMILASTLPRIDLNLVDLQWLQVLSEGWATPLYGFMRERQYLQCLHHGQLFDLDRKCTEPNFDENSDSDVQLQSSISQSVLIVLPIDEHVKHMLIVDGNLPNQVSLYYDGAPMAILSNPEIYTHRKEERVARTFGTVDRAHPAIEMIFNSGDWLIGGDIECLQRIVFNDGLDHYRLTPLELRQRFIDKKADVVFAFQLRNPIHNGHALLMNDTRDHLLAAGYENPVLLLHPLGGWTKDDDVPLAIRIEQHHAVLQEAKEQTGQYRTMNSCETCALCHQFSVLTAEADVCTRHLDPDWTVLAIFPSPMLYAGPVEVQWHARARLAAGINAYIVGRDPAGIQKPGTGDFLYDPTHGAKVLSMTPGLPNLDIVPFRVAAYDKTIQKMAFFDESRKEDFLFISGTKMRAFAREGQEPPKGFMAHKAWQVPLSM